MGDARTATSGAVFQDAKGCLEAVEQAMMALDLLHYVGSESIEKSQEHRRRASE